VERDCLCSNRFPHRPHEKQVDAAGDGAVLGNCRRTIKYSSSGVKTWELQPGNVMFKAVSSRKPGRRSGGVNAENQVFSICRRRMATNRYQRRELTPHRRWIGWYSIRSKMLRNQGLEMGWCCVGRGEARQERRTSTGSSSSKTQILESTVFSGRQLHGGPPKANHKPIGTTVWMHSGTIGISFDSHSRPGTRSRYLSNRWAGASHDHGRVTGRSRHRH